MFSYLLGSSSLLLEQFCLFTGLINHAYGSAIEIDGASNIKTVMLLTSCCSVAIGPLNYIAQWRNDPEGDVFK